MDQESKYFSIVDSFHNLYLVIFSFGTLANILSLIIFSSKKFHKSIFSTYFFQLTICDTLTLILTVDHFFEFKYKTSFNTISNLSCKFRSYYEYVLPAVSAWTQVFISLDRFLSITLPYKLKSRKTKFFQLTICLMIISFNLVLYFPLFFSQIQITYFDINTNKSESSCIIFNPDGLIDWLDLFISTLIPFVIMSVSNGTMLIKIFNSRKRLHLISHDVSIKIRDIKFAITSITLNFLFFTFNFPITFFFLSDNFFQLKSDDLIELIDIIVSLIFYLNFSVIFFISFLSNNFFRKEFFVIVNKIKSLLKICFISENMFK